MFRIRAGNHDYTVLFDAPRTLDRLTDKGFESVDITQCRILEVTPEGQFRNYASGTSIRRPDDPNDITLGRKRALQAALRYFAYEQRKPFWNAFRKVTSKPTQLASDAQKRIADIDEELAFCSAHDAGCAVCDALREEKAQLLTAA